MRPQFATYCDRTGRFIKVNDTVERLSGKRGKVVDIDVWGYVRLEGEVSTFYAPHLMLVM